MLQATPVPSECDPKCGSPYDRFMISLCDVEDGLLARG